MLNKYLPLKGVALLLLFFFLWGNKATAQSCNLNFQNPEGCVDINTTFSATGSGVAGADSIIWDLGGNRAMGSSTGFVFTTPGTKNICYTVYKNGSQVCKPCTTFTVNKNPTADFVLDPAYKAFQCYNNNYYCFIDQSTQGEPGNPIQRVTFLFGDGAADSGTSAVGGPWCHRYDLQTGQKYKHTLRIWDTKGCFSEKEIEIAQVDDDIALEFSTNDPMKCLETVTNINNTTLLPLNRIQAFNWDFGDGETYTSSDTSGNFDGVDSCYWMNPVHVYTQHGCFNASLFAKNDSGCKDTFTVTNFQCNINPNMDITANPNQSQCFAGNDFLMSSQVKLFNGMVMSSFLWDFGDPDSGPANFDDINLDAAPHKYSKPDLFTASLTVRINGCDFTGTKSVLTKGPGATIENKMIPDIIHDTMRHQCQIKDTVFFPNNSSFFLNDRSFMNDIEPGAATTIDKSQLVYLLKNDPALVYWENIIDTYYWGNDTFSVVPHPLKYPNLSGHLIVHSLPLYRGYYGAITGKRKGEHVRLVWDFGDAQDAPQCTTWTKYNQNVYDYSRPYYHWVDTVVTGTDTTRTKRMYDPLVDSIDFGKVTDTTYAWMNCNFSRDPLPKHWYTPGTEKCFTVRLTMEDTTLVQSADSIYYSNNFFGLDSGAVMNDSFYRFGPVYALDSIFGRPPLLDVNGDTVWKYSPYCASEIIGYEEDTSKPQDVFLSVDTIYNIEWKNPNVLNNEICESVGTVMLAFGPPEASGLRWEGIPCYGPNPNGGFFSWQQSKPGCTQQYMWIHFDSLADRTDNTPNVMDKWSPQDALWLDRMRTPWPMGTMNMPTWPTSIFHQYNPGAIADSCGWLTIGLRIQNGKNPNSNQPCIDEKWYHNFMRYSLADPRFTYTPPNGCNPMDIEMTLVKDVQDSIEAIVFFYQNTDPNFFDDVEQEIDSVFRNIYDPVTGDFINYVITYKVGVNGVPHKVDSVAFEPGVGGVQQCGNEVRFKKTRTHTLHRQGRYAVGVAMSTVAGTNQSCNSIAQPGIIVTGFYKDAWADKTIACRNETVNFMDTTLYFLRDEVNGDILLRYNYWHKPEQETYDDQVTPRTWPVNQREKFWYDFDQGLGFVAYQGTPTESVLDQTYPVPGYYNIQAAFADSLGCTDTVDIPLYITGTSANFGYDVQVTGCEPIVNFFDSSVMLDPCYLRNGVRCDSIIRWEWHFGDGTSINSNNQNGRVPITDPAHVYREFGDYDVKLIIETSLGCLDTIERTVFIEGPRPRFEFVVDSVGCAPFTVYLRNVSKDPAPDATWTINFGDNSSMITDLDTNISHTYDIAGTYTFTVYQVESVPLQPGPPCQDTFSIQIKVLPNREVDFIASRTEVCPNDTIMFTEQSDSIYSSFQWIIQDLRNDSTVYDTVTRDSSLRTYTHKWSSPGEYIVRLNADYTPAAGEPKCLRTKSMKIFVREVEAAFTVDSTAANKPNFFFTNTSTNGIKYWWRFGDGDDYVQCPLVDMANCPNASHNYGDNIGNFEVCLVAESPEGCFDTACEMVNNYYEIFINIPNVFTPNGDGFNDSFKVEYQSLVKYEITIFNRWGTKVYESTDPDAGWNGKNMNSGQDCPAGAYYVVIKYQLRGQSEEKEYKGTCTLIR